MSDSSVEEKGRPNGAALVKEKLKRCGLLAAANQEQGTSQSGQGNGGWFRDGGGGDGDRRQGERIASPNVRSDGLKAKLHMT